MEKGKRINNYCPDCLKGTNHTVKEVVVVEGSFEHQVSRYYAIVQCDGCNTISYRTETKDFEMMYYDEQDSEYYPQTLVEYYPQTLRLDQSVLNVALLPEKIQIVYQDTIRAFTSKSYLLTAIGFRTIIEAVCIHQDIKLKEIEDLKPQIDKMVKKNLITPREAARLHTIRFSGNDSAHDMVVPKEDDLYVVMNIVNHLLNNLYIIDNQIKGGLEKVVTDFKAFRTLLSSKIGSFAVGDSATLGKILGKSARRLNDHGPVFERELLDKIEKGEYVKLAKGEVRDHPDKNRPPVQFYTIMDLSWDNDAEF